MGRPNTVVVVSAAEAEQLGAIARSRSLPHSLVRRARIVLMSAEGVPNQSIAERCGVSVPTISHWRRSWRERGVAGLHGELRPGRPRSYDDEQVAALMRKVLHGRPPNATHWSVRSVAQDTGISKSTVARYFALFGLQPHRSKSFKLSTDPFFVEKVRDVVGLYLNPPDKALVLCVDEKSQVQALERTQPVLPIGLGYVERVTHDYYRHGTTTLFAALNVLDGSVIAQCKPRHRHQEFIGFLNYLDRQVPADLEVHLIADNYATHKTSQGQSLARAPSALPPPPHPHLRQLAQSGGALVRAHHSAGDPPRLVPLGARTGPQNRRLRHSLQHFQPPLHLDRHGRFYPRQDSTPL